jgi:NADPH:quinone reductase
MVNRLSKAQLATLLTQASPLAYRLGCRVTAAPSRRGFQGIPQRDIHFTATFVRSYAQEFEKLDRLRQQVEAGKITLRVAEVYPPERAADAHRRLEAGGTRGRLVIQF